MTTESPLLPPEFEDLEPFARTWALPTMTDRYQRRLASTMDEMRAFYDVAVPRGEAAIDHLCTFPLHDLPEPELHLLWLMASLSCVSFAIDIFHQPRIPSAGDAYLPWTTHLEP